MKESAIETAMWAGDVDHLHEIAPCVCCCAEHTFSDCPARQWDGCLGGQEPAPHETAEAWAKHYEAFHGMNPEVFFGVD